jgi:hypothetical protein
VFTFDEENRLTDSNAIFSMKLKVSCSCSASDIVQEWGSTKDIQGQWQYKEK